MKRAREFKGKPNWKAVVMQSALCGHVGDIHRATHDKDGVQAFDDKAAIECVDRRNYEGLKIMLDHLTPKHYTTVLYHCADLGYLKELKLCLSRADADAVVGATNRVARNNRNAALPLMVQHLKQHTYSRNARERMIEGVYSENLDVLPLFQSSIERFNPEQSAKALTYAAKHNGKAIPYLLENATTPVFELFQIRD